VLQSRSRLLGQRGPMFFDPVFWIAYIAIALVVGFLGHGRRIGVIGFFILALLLTPPLVLLVLVVTRPKPLKRATPTPRG
jgi:Sec-independent protein secretion pathway component TatC